MTEQLKINGFCIFVNEDEAIYVAKSREDIYEYFVEMYGSTEDCQNETKEEFIENLTEIDLSSDYCKKVRTWISDDDGSEWESSYYDEYAKSANKNDGVDVIAYLVW
jgi:hypothetical protein